MHALLVQKGLTTGEGGVGVSELINRGVCEGSYGCHPCHRTVVQQLGHLRTKSVGVKLHVDVELSQHT